MAEVKIDSGYVNDFDIILKSVQEDVQTLTRLEKEIVGNLQLKNESPKKSSNCSNWLDLPPETELSFMSRRIVHLASYVDGNYYCPFCPLRHVSDLGLKTHLKQKHHPEIDLLWTKKCENFQYECCPCCGAKFYLKGVCLEHYVTYHSKFVLDSCKSITCRNENSSCSLKTSRSMKSDSLVKHLLKEHGREFEDILLESGKRTEHQTSIQTGDSLVLVSPVKNFLSAPENTYCKQPVKRALHFNMTNSTNPSTDESDEAEISAGNDIDGLSLLLDDFIIKASPSPKKKGFWKSKKKRNKKKNSSPKPKFTSTPLKRRRKMAKILTKFHFLFHSHFSPSSPSRMYRCGSCQLRFHDNHQLVSHVRRHFCLRMRPIFSCGLCPAQFYENRFLLKHCAEQHLQHCFTPIKSM